MQQTTLQTAVLLRKWGRGDKHPPTCVYNFSEDDKSYCPSYFFSRFKAQTVPECRRKVPTDHSHAEQFTPQIMHIFFLCANRIIQHMASVTPVSLPEVLLHSLWEDRLFWSSLLKLAHPFESTSLSYSSTGVTEVVDEILHGGTQTDKLPKELKCTSPDWANEVFLHAQCILWCIVVKIRIHLVLRYYSRGR